MGVGGEGRDGEWPGNIARDVVAQVVDAARGRHRIEGHAELALPAGALQVHHQLPGHPHRGLAAEILRDQREGQIQAGGEPGAGPHVTVADEDRVGVHRDRRMFGGELAGGRPVCGGTFAVQQTGVREDVRADAYRGHSPGAAGRSAHPVHYYRIGHRAHL